MTRPRSASSHGSTLSARSFRQARYNTCVRGASLRHKESKFTEFLFYRLYAATFLREAKSKMTDNVCNLKAEHFIPHQTHAAQKSRTSDKKLSSTRISVRGVF